MLDIGYRNIYWIPQTTNRVFLKTIRSNLIRHLRRIVLPRYLGYQILVIEGSRPVLEANHPREAEGHKYHRHNLCPCVHKSHF